MGNYVELFPSDAQDLIKTRKSDPSFVIVDVRTSKEFEKGHVPSAFHFDVYEPQFQEKILALDKKKAYLIYCKTGGRSRATAEFMCENGFEQVYFVRGWLFEDEQEEEEECEK